MSARRLSAMRRYTGSCIVGSRIPGSAGSNGGQRLAGIGGYLAGENDELIAVGGKHGDGQPERLSRAVIGRSEGLEHRHAAVIWQLEKSSLFCPRCPDGDPV